MFCPNCKYEYKEGITVCPDCGATLVKKLEQEPKLNFSTAELCDVENEVEVNFIISVLEENGIECFLRENFLPHSRVVMGENKKYGTIVVNKEKLEQAKEILKEIK